VIYRRLASPLHAARAGAGAAYAAALAIVALESDHPLILGAVIVAVVAAALLAGCRGALRTGLLIGVPMALLVAVVNPFVTRDGLTVIARLGDLPPFGQLDLTLEATAYGAVLGLRALALVLVFALYSAAVDPDELLGLARRVAPRSALTATLATRMVPILARDARRMAEAQRSRAHRPAPRLALMRAVAGGALDRAVDVAATLELRGWAGTRPRRRAAAPWSRHDIAFAASAVAMVALALLVGPGGVAPFSAYPAIHADTDAGTIAVALSVVAVALAPFAERRGIAA
jgi:energy-coupling factor transport system permease protein